MKTRNYTTLFGTLLLTAAMAVFTSCDRDRDQAYVLSGDWTGDFGMYYYDGFTGYTHWADYTDIRFIPAYDYATYGHGEEIDFFAWPCPIKYQSFYFNWEIRNGVVYLYYPYAHDLDVAIYDYRLRRDYFAGYLGDSYDWFRLTKLNDFYGWNSYDPYSYYGYSYYDDYYYGYAKSRDGQSDSQSTVSSGTADDFKFGRDLKHRKTTE